LPLQHPAAKFLVELSMAQDELVGDGTTSVVILTGELLHRALDLISKGVPVHVINQVWDKKTMDQRIYYYNKEEKVFRARI